ncbi:GCN5 family N-acetyltransferase [Actinomycetes bacterium]|nr:GCN5 family N-acetyltransferase [Actinomycetes bacterium]
MTISVRPLNSKDKSRWLELWHDYLTFYETSLSSEQTELTWKRLMDSNYGVFGLMAEKDGAIVGITHFMYRPSTWAPKDYCYLEDLFVDPTVRGSGAGRALINRVIELAKEHGAGRVYWTTKENNAQARILYDSFIKVSEFVQYRFPLNP